MHPKNEQNRSSTLGPRHLSPGGTLNVEVIGIGSSEIFLENPKNTQILILNA